MAIPTGTHVNYRAQHILTHGASRRTHIPQTGVSDPYTAVNYRTQSIMNVTVFMTERIIVNSRQVNTLDIMVIVLLTVATVKSTVFIVEQPLLVKHTVV